MRKGYRDQLLSRHCLTNIYSQASPAWHDQAKACPSMRSGIGDLKFFQRKDKKKDEKTPNGVDGAAEDLSHMRFGQG